MIIDFILVLVLMVCAYTDLKYRKIFNVVIIPGFLFALIYNFLCGSWQGLFQSVSGFAIGLGLLLIPFVLGGMGAGDVKLLAMVGAFKGPVFVFYAFLCAALIGGVMAVIILLYQRQLSSVGRNLFSCLFLFFFRGFRSMSYKVQNLSTLPYGMAIALGTLFAYWVG